MAIRPILTDPDPRLRLTCSAVTVFDDGLRELIGDLFDTLRSTGAIGLSAPQIGVLKRVLVVHVPDDERGPRAYVNPRILDARQPGFIDESCLSVPGIEGSVWRPTRIRLSCADDIGETQEHDVDGLHAVCVQHEIDHLDGRLFTDRLAWFSRLRLRLQGAEYSRRQAA